MEQVRTLRREGRDAELEALLLRMIDAAEVEASTHGWTSPAAYYLHAAILFRRQRRFADEVRVVQRQIAFWAKTGHHHGQTKYRLGRAQRLFRRQTALGRSKGS